MMSYPIYSSNWSILDVFTVFLNFIAFLMRDLNAKYDSDMTLSFSFDFYFLCVCVCVCITVNPFLTLGGNPSSQVR